MPAVRLAFVVLLGAIGIAQGAIGIAFGEPPGQIMPKSIDEQPGENPGNTKPARSPAIAEQPERAAYPADYQRACNQPESPEEADLCQQWRMAKATEELVHLTMFSCGWPPSKYCLSSQQSAFAAWSAWAAAQAANAASENNRISRRAIIAQQRAWVPLKDIRIISPLIWAGRQCDISVEFKFMNTGNTPARNLAIDAKLVLFPHVNPAMTYKELALIANRTSGFSYTLFPNDDMSWPLRLSLTEADVSEYYNHMRKTAVIMWSPTGQENVELSDEQIPLDVMLVMSGNYELVFEDERGKVGCIRRLVWMRDGRRKIIGPTHGNIHAHELCLDRWFQGDVIAE